MEIIAEYPLSVEESFNIEQALNEDKVLTSITIREGLRILVNEVEYGYQSKEGYDVLVLKSKETGKFVAVAFEKKAVQSRFKKSGDFADTYSKRIDTKDKKEFITFVLKYGSFRKVETKS